MSGNIPIMRLLLELGADVNLRTQSEGDTALHIAVMNSNIEMVRALLAGGAEVNATDRLLRTPLLRASGIGNLQIMQTLVSAGADVDRPMSTRLTPLGFAAQRGRADAVIFLAERSVKVSRAYFGYSPLPVLVRHGLTSAVAALLAAGADIDGVDEEGNTALYTAVTRRREELIELLMACGADPCRPVHEGDTPCAAIQRTMLHLNVSDDFLWRLRGLFPTPIRPATEKLL